jgi:hypothetical protein
MEGAGVEPYPPSPTAPPYSPLFALKYLMTTCPFIFLLSSFLFVAYLRIQVYPLMNED